MKDNVTTYKIWAPDEALWAQWAKPVLFAVAPTDKAEDIVLPDIAWTAAVDYRTAVILDLPGSSAVLEGLALARIGYRPVPLYNGVNAPPSYSMIVDVKAIVSALYAGAELLQGFSMRPDAPPVFLLDANRMQGSGKEPGRFDNRWCVFPQDMPSADFLQRQGIDRVIVRSDINSIRSDLSHILCRYQEQGITVYLSGRSELPKVVNVTPPSQFKSMLYRAKVAAGLTRNPAGGFGGPIPEPTQSGGSGGVRVYGRIG